MTTDALTAILAERVMRWVVTPNRFLIGRRRWIPLWRFQPFTRLEDAFRLLEKAGGTYTLTKTTDGIFTARVRVAGRTGDASDESKATSITLAVARAMGLDVPDETAQSINQGVDPSPCKKKAQVRTP